MIAAPFLVVLSLPVLGCTTYLAALAVLSFGRLRMPRSVAPRTRFDVIVPAHDEESGIGATVASLLASDYPPDLRRIVVVADNCTDATAARAAEAGAVVFERRDASLRGKGYALAFAFDRVLARPPDATASASREGLVSQDAMGPSFRAPDATASASREGGEPTAPEPHAIVVVDADTHVTPNLLQAFDARLQAGAAAVQAHYGVLNPRASWRTRLMHIGFTLFHDVRSRARERIGVSAGLRGNGMAFAAATLREIPHEAFSIVEDVEYGIRLGLSGRRVHYAGEAHVLGEMVSSEKASRSQRRRWEGGRWLLARRHAGLLLREGFRRKSPLLLDLAADLLVPPLSYVVLATVAGAAASAVCAAVLHGALWVLVPWGGAVLGLASYVARGLWLSGVGARGALDLLWAPVYVLWKVALALRSPPSRKREWVRTTREGTGR